MKKILAVLLLIPLIFTGCSVTPMPPSGSAQGEATAIVLSDQGITVNGQGISSSPSQAVYSASDIVYYPTGKDFTFGEGSGADCHDPSLAAAHTVVHITKPGTYSISGKLSAGQIAVDLGKDAEDDPNAVVTLVLNGLDITCSVAPAIIFYNVYECDTAQEHSQLADTSAAGANVILADNSHNTVNGSYVARIYEPDSVELNKKGTKVKDAEKLHKYDGAFYSKMSMNIGGSGSLTINAQNEGLDTERHLTINGGDITINSGNDGINTNEDEVSVTTINGGSLSITVHGATGEGDGIDSNGWLVINGGTVAASACDASADAGIDSDMGIYINGGTVIAGGTMLDRIAGGEQTFAVFEFAAVQQGGLTYRLVDKTGNTVISAAPANGFTTLILSCEALSEDEYTLFCGDTQLGGVSGQGFGGMHRPQLPQGEMPEGMDPPELPEGEIPEGGQFPQMPDGEIPEAGQRPELPEGMEPPEMPEGVVGPAAPNTDNAAIFTLIKGANYFSAVSPLQ